MNTPTQPHTLLPNLDVATGLAVVYFFFICSAIGLGSRHSLQWAAVVQWNHACFGILEVSKRTGSNPVHGLSVGQPAKSNKRL
ncbi:hypothetical protein E2C01_014411 [Portunus trituberculatus]|uniref:Uncharacterized protein n=1 Tax=Portunus trituberculatus TaxID=210409 RepID=A0A5B7DJT7_PORTR|nr:hypothetical protein [Portunus trituberculatus]